MSLGKRTAATSHWEEEGWLLWNIRRLEEARGISKLTGETRTKKTALTSCWGTREEGRLLSVAERLGKRGIIPNSSDRSTGRGSGRYLVHLRQLRGNYCK